MCHVLYIGGKKKKKKNIFSPYAAYSQARDIGTLIINDKVIVESAQLGTKGTLA